MENEISMMTTTDVFYEIGFFSHPNEMTLKDAQIYGGGFRSMCFLAANPFFIKHVLSFACYMLTVGINLALGIAFSGADLMTAQQCL